MASWALYDQVAQTIPFSLNGRDGKVAVYYGVNDDSVRAGFDAIPGVSFPIELCLDYPVIHAEIDSYAGSGYRTFCGWIQIVTRDCRRTAEDGDSRYAEASIDLAPSIEPLGMPFASYGPAPQLFDAPCLNLGDNYELKWIADSFLTTVPARSRDLGIERLLSFRWGYVEYDERAQKPVTLLPLEVTGPEAWNAHLPLLEREFPKWRFSRA